MSVVFDAVFQEQPVILAALFHSISQAAIFTQTGLYAAAADPDPCYSKLYVSLLFLLILFQTILELVKMWMVSIAEKTWDALPGAWLELLLNGVLCAILEVPLILRCWKLSGHNIWLPLFLALLTLAAFVSNGFVAAYFDHALVEYTDVPSSKAVKGDIAFSYWLFSNFAVDMANCLIFLRYALQAKPLSLSSITLKRLVDFLLESSMLPAIFQTTSVLIFVIPASTINLELILLFSCFTAKLHSHGLLSMLVSNVRDRRPRIQMKNVL